MQISPGKITNEDQAIELIHNLLEGSTLPEGYTLELEGWPRFVVHIKGADFDGTIPTRIMPTMLELQKEINKAYCLILHGDENVRRLSKKDREQLELLVKVDKGSSIYETLLLEPLIKIFQDSIGKMPPEYIVMTVLGLGAFITVGSGWKSWLNKKARDKELDQNIELSQLDKDKWEIVMKAMSQITAGGAIAENIDNVRQSFAEKLKDDDVLQLPSQDDGVSQKPVTLMGTQAKMLTRTPREKAQEKLITDRFFIRSVDFSRDEGIRAELERGADGYRFRADIPLGVFPDDQNEALKNNAWERKQLEMEVLAKELHNRYTSAKVVRVKVSDDPQFNA